MKRTLVLVVLICTGILLVAQQDCQAIDCYVADTNYNHCSGYQIFEWGGWYGSGAEYCYCNCGLMWTSCEQDPTGPCKTYYWYDGRPSQSTTAYQCLVGDFCNIT
jgi:hypothetical protein